LKLIRFGVEMSEEIKLSMSKHGAALLLRLMHGDEPDFNKDECDELMTIYKNLMAELSHGEQEDTMEHT